MYNWYMIWTLARMKQSELLKEAEHRRFIEKQEKMMKYEEILQKLAPCGLNCYK